jgi:hypothetical protein
MAMIEFPLFPEKIAPEFDPGLLKVEGCVEDALFCRNGFDLAQSNSTNKARSEL